MMENGTLFLAVAAAAALAGWLVMSGIGALRRRLLMRQRMARISGILVAEEQGTEGRESALAPVVDKGGGWRENWLVARLSARYPLAGGVRTALLAVVSGLFGFLAMMAALAFLGVAAPVSYVASALAGGGLAWNVGTLLEDAKRSEFSSRFLVILEDIQRMVRYGISGHQALSSAVAAADEPVKTSLSNILQETDFGVSMGIAMNREAQRTRIGELMMLAAVFSTQSSAGGSLSESIENLSKTLRARLDNRTRMKSATAESRITMIILALVPVAGVSLQALAQPELVDELLGEARHLLGIGVGLIVGGLLVSWMMIRRAQR